MWCRHSWAVCLVLTFLTHGCYHANGSDEGKAIKDVMSILEDLQFIEEQEEIQRSDDGVVSTIEAENDYCKALLDLELDVGSGEDFDKILKKWSDCSAIWSWQMATAEWNFETDINPETEAELNRVLVEVTGHFQKLAGLAKQATNAPGYADLDVTKQREFRLMSMDDAPKSEETKKKLSELQTKLQNTYSNAEVNGKPMEPDLTKLMASSRVPDELERYWVGWRDATGKRMKDDYEKFVEYVNSGAVENGYHDYGESWLKGQFDDVVDIKKVSEDLWQEVKPLYQHLHAYVRSKLQETYPKYSDIYDKGGIPAHLTGNMWAQQWNNIYELAKPFPEIEEPNYDKALKDQGYTVEGLFDLAEEFYTSIGLFPMPQKFHQYSMIERPSDRDVVCHASASDFYLHDDVRIKMCTEVNTEYLDTIHHEMGHVEYFIAYKDQPTVFRNGANSGFHEAIGDTISLSVMTPKHMKAINLTEDYSTSVTKSKDGLTVDEKREINSLLKVALSKIAFLPFGYLIDKWRWDVFDGTKKINEYNKHWWDLRLKYQGVVSPVNRSEADFDPGAKFHIPANAPYLCYFISFILQFQFYESMCKASGQLDNNELLHNCDFYQSTAAGTLLKDMMALGESQPWNETLKSMTGSTEISTSSILNYFKPLQKWLEEENTKNGNTIGWDNAEINWVSQSETRSRFGHSRKTVAASKEGFHSRYNLLTKLSNSPRQNVNSKLKKSRHDKEMDKVSYFLDLIRQLSDD